VVSGAFWRSVLNEINRAHTEPPGHPGEKRIVNALTIDIEDWYQGIELEPAKWSAYESRVADDVVRMLDILESAKVKASFFALGRVAEEHPDIIRRVHEAGHEIATHGYDHQFIYRQAPKEFAADLERSIEIIESIVPEKVVGYRAPFFSVTKETLWALSILAEHGIKYDSSIFPIRNYRYGIPKAPRFMHSISCNNGNSLVEVPISTMSMFSQNIPFAGGAYLRFFPYPFIKWGIQRLNLQGHSAVVYVHPWEIDPNHPRIELPRRISLTHYLNLHSTEQKIRMLLRDFRFDTLANVVSSRRAAGEMEGYRIDDGALLPIR